MVDWNKGQHHLPLGDELPLDGWGRVGWLVTEIQERSRIIRAAKIIFKLSRIQPINLQALKRSYMSQRHQVVE